MEQRIRRNSGWGLLAAGLVFAVGFFVRMATGDPTGPMAPFAGLFGVLGLKQLWSSRRGRAPEPRGDGRPESLGEGGTGADEPESVTAGR